MAIKIWPPDNWKKVYDKYAEWAAWYSGDPAELLKVYMSQSGPFWAKDIQEDRKTMLHVPVAGDIAGVSADLLLSEPPDIKIPEAHEEKAQEGAKETQDRLDEIVYQIDLYSRMLEGAETSSALGGFFAKVNWNHKFKPFPIISIAHADNAIPVFRWGFLTEVIFHKIVDYTDSNETLRHLEIHKPGVIINQLWKGNIGDLGQQVQLSYHDTTAKMEEEIKTGLDTLACIYIPNKKPNRLWRDTDLGQSDLSGIEGLMDALDEVYTSWLRDIRLCKGRIIVPDYMLELDEETGKFKFDLDREVYEAVNAGPVDTEKGDSITSHQFEIRAEQHQKTAYNLLEQVYNNAGYSPSSFGMNTEGGQIQTATEVKAREGKSFKTRNKKARYFQNGISDILYIALQIDKLHFNTPGIVPYRPQTSLQDSIQTDPMEKADSIEKLDRATAMSIDTKVRTLHKDWTEEQIEKEVKLIMKEQGIDVEPPEVRV